MPKEDSAPSRRIMLSGLAAGALTPDTAISLVDDAGSTLPASCRQCGWQLRGARERTVLGARGPLRAGQREPHQQLRTLIGTENTSDIAALLRAASVPEAPVKKRGIAHLGEHDRKDR
jgi:hypothetical protein